MYIQCCHEQRWSYLDDQFTDLCDGYRIGTNKVCETPEEWQELDEQITNWKTNWGQCKCPKCSYWNANGHYFYNEYGQYQNTMSIELASTHAEVNWYERLEVLEL